MKWDLKKNQRKTLLWLNNDEIKNKIKSTHFFRWLSQNNSFHIRPLALTLQTSLDSEKNSHPLPSGTEEDSPESRCSLYMAGNCHTPAIVPLSDVVGYGRLRSGVLGFIAWISSAFSLMELTMVAPGTIYCWSGSEV